MMLAPLRFHDGEEVISRFLDRVLVRCPQCARCAFVVPLEGPRANTVTFGARRLSCLQCGLTRDRDLGLSIASTAPIDPFFGLPLYLRTTVDGEDLWAFNERHLEFLQRFIAATLRSRRIAAGHGPRNSTLASRLPRWMKRGVRREVILAGLARLAALAARQ
jgi:hypothetical protein